MNILELKVIRQFGASITYFTLVLVVGLALWLCGNIFSPPSGSTTLASVARQNRQPSSVAVASAAVTPVTFDSAKPDVKTDTKVETVALDCLRDGGHLDLKSSAHQIRLRSDLCRGHKVDLDKSNIINRANGFEATLFQLEKGGFSSDYINLVDGTNDIVIQLTDSRGRKISTQVTISRVKL